MGNSAGGAFCVSVCVAYSADKVHSRLMSKCILVVSVEMNFNRARRVRRPRACHVSPVAGTRAGNACVVFAYGRPGGRGMGMRLGTCYSM